MTQVANKIIELINSLQKRRYPTIIVIDDDSSPITKEDINIVTKECSLRHIDYFKDVISNPDNSITLGAYHRGRFIEWILEQARSSNGLLIEKTGSLISSWLEEDRKAFFMEFLRTECNSPNDSTSRIPIVLISRMAGNFNLPTSKRGQGIVFYTK